METSIATIREQGLEALRQGDPAQAAELLSQAVATDAQDAEAQAFLGVAYSQKGLHDQAVRALQTAVEMRAGEARYRFNLGVALENGGDSTGAAAAFREALRLNPQHAAARLKLQALGGTDDSFVSARPENGTTPSVPASRWAPGGSGTNGSPGAVQCPSCRQWSKPGLTCEWCNSTLKSAPMRSDAPWLQPGNVSLRDEREAAGPSPVARPRGMSVFIVLNDIGAIFMVIAGIVMLAGVGAVASRGGVGQQGMTAASILGISILFLILGLAVLIVGHFLWKGSNWARIAYMAILVINLLATIAQFVQGSKTGVPTVSLLGGIWFLSILNSQPAKDFCNQ